MADFDMILDLRRLSLGAVMRRFLVLLVVAAVGFAATPVSSQATAGGRAVATRHDAAPSGYARVDRVIEPKELGVEIPGRVRWDERAGALVINDLRTGVARVVDTAGRVLGRTRATVPDTGSPLSARDPRSGHAFTLDPGARLLREIDEAGRLVSTRDLGEAPLRAVQGMAFAPSGDPTDGSDALGLFISDAGATEDGSTVDAGVWEFALTEPTLSATLEATTTGSGQLVSTINTANWDPASPDPSGLAYIPGLDRLVAADGEVDETTGAGWHDVNVWTSTRGGAAQGALNTKLADPTNNEPVGAAYDAVRGELYIAKDGSSSRVWVYRVIGTTFTQVRTFSLATLGVTDAEGLGFGANTLFVADGTGKEIWKIPGGLDGVVGTGDEGPIPHFDTAALGINDPEGVDYHPVTGNLWVASRPAAEGLLEVTPAGAPVSTVDYAGFTPVSPAGVAIAPSSGDPTRYSVWVAARGVDNGSNPNENDGKIYELSVTATDPGPLPTPGTSVIANGGFEEARTNGTPSAWTENSNFMRSSSQVLGGAYAGRHASTADVGYTISQDAQVVGGEQYVFEGFVNAPPTTDAFRLVLKIQWRASSKISVVTIGKVAASTSGWRQFRATVTAPASATTGRVMMVVSSLNTTLYVDEFTLAVAQ